MARSALVGHAPGSTEVSGVVRGDTLVLRAVSASGPSVTVDARGRIYLPVWLRRHLAFLIGTHHDADDAAVVVVVVPAALFDAIGDRLLERVR